MQKKKIEIERNAAASDRLLRHLKNTKKLLTKYARVSIIAFVFNTYARVAQLVEHDLAKVGAAGSSPVSRSFYF